MGWPPDWLPDMCGYMMVHWRAGRQCKLHDPLQGKVPTPGSSSVVICLRLSAPLGLHADWKLLAVAACNVLAYPGWGDTFCCWGAEGPVIGLCGHERLLERHSGLVDAALPPHSHASRRT